MHKKLTLTTLIGLIFVQAAQAAPSFEYRKPSPGLAVSAPSSGASSPGSGTGTTPPAGGGTTPPALTYVAEYSAQTLDFKEVRVGTTSEQSVLLTNLGTGGLTLGSPETTGAAYSGLTQCGTSLAVGSSCQTTVTFAPNQVGALSGTLRVPVNTTSALTSVTLTGTGVQSEGALTADSSFSFGQAVVGTPVTKSFTFTNSGTADALAAFAQLQGDAAFSISSTSCGTSGQQTLVPKSGGTCTVTVRYAPLTSSAGTSTNLTVHYEQTRSASKTLTASARFADSAGASLKLLIPANTSIADVSLAPKSLTINGNVTLSATNKYGGGAIAFDGSTNTGTNIVVANSADFGFGTGDFTIETWVYPNGTQVAYATVMDFRAPGSSTQTKPTIFIGNSSGNVNIRLNARGSQLASYVAPVNTWHHVAYSRTAGVGKFFINGNQVGSNIADTNDYGSTSDIVLGNVGDNRTNYTTGFFKGYLDDVRVTKGIGRYTANFTVPAEHPLP